MALNGVMAVTLRYFTELGKPVFQHITASICGGIYARVHVLVRVRCRRTESSRSLSHLLMRVFFVCFIGFNKFYFSFHFFVFRSFYFTCFFSPHLNFLFIYMWFYSFTWFFFFSLALIFLFLMIWRKRKNEAHFQSLIVKNQPHFPK